MPALAKEVAAIIRGFEPTADVILYGSRARGDAEPDSDWDFLVLLDEKPDLYRARKIRHAVYDLEFACGEVLTLMFDSKSEWQDLDSTVPDFFDNVSREGMAV